MRILPGAPQEFANQTPTSKHMSQYLIASPHMLAQVTTLFSKSSTAFSSLLAGRNMFSGKLADPLNPKSGKYKIVGNRKVMWNVKGYPDRKARVIAAFKCDAFPNEPGRNQTWIDLYLDTNWFSPKDVLELADNQTYVHVSDSTLPQEIDAGIFHYRVKIMTNVSGDFVNPNLLAIGQEVSISHTSFEEMSETAYEKYTFDEKAYTHMTIQRLKWSISGTADEYRPSAIWMEHNGVSMWADHAQIQMLERAATYREKQLLNGKSTVTADDKVLLKTNEGFEVMAGDGILNQGDGAWRLPYNVMSTRVIDNIMENISIYSSSWGKEVAVICGMQFYKGFAKLMRDQAGIDPKTVEMGGNGKKGINLDYEYYEFGGVKMIPTVVPWFDSPMRATTYGADGTRNSSHNAIFVSLGDVEINQPAIELLQLGKRGWLEGEVNGINKGGDMANSVDGKHHHILWETGAALLDVNGIAELYRPVKY
jgi:hypothetical protein